MRFWSKKNFSNLRMKNKIELQPFLQFFLKTLKFKTGVNFYGKITAQLLYCNESLLFQGTNYSAIIFGVSQGLRSNSGFLTPSLHIGPLDQFHSQDWGNFFAFSLSAKHYVLEWKNSLWIYKLLNRLWYLPLQIFYKLIFQFQMLVGTRSYFLFCTKGHLPTQWIR